MIVALLGTLYLINFLDKSVLGLSAVKIMSELSLSPASFGLLNSVFFALFVPMQMIGGVLADRWPTRHILLAMALIWSLSMLPLGLPGGLGTLVASRVLLGFGEGPTSPVAIHALYKWFPDEKRALPNAVYVMGGPLAMILGAPVLVWIIASGGWRAAFVALGCMSLAWSALWFMLGKEGPLVAPRESRGLPGAGRYLRLVFSRTFIGCLLLGFPSYFAMTLMFSWMPHFLEAVLHFSNAATGATISAAWIIVGFGPIPVSMLSQALIARGVSTRMARGVMSAALLILAGLLLAMTPHLPISGPVQARLLMGALALGVVCNPLLFTLLGQLSPIELRGGVVGCFGSGVVSAGLFAPTAMGYAIQAGADERAGYAIGFTSFGALATVCGLAALVLINPEADKRFAHLRTTSNTKTSEDGHGRWSRSR